MNAYVYRAALLCEDCGEQAERECARNVVARELGDSDRYPQGPYLDGGGEADSPCYCDSCGLFLENPLTSDGEEYVREHLSDRGAHVAPEWRECYDYLFTGDEEEDSGA